MASILTNIISGLASGAEIKADTEGLEFAEKEKAVSPPLKSADNNTLLKQTVSLAGALVSRSFTQPVFGVKIPVYENTLGDKLINPIKDREALSSREESFAEPKISKFHNATRNIANALIATANVPIFIVSRESIPLLKTEASSLVNDTLNSTKNTLKNWYKENKDNSLLAQAAGGLNSVHIGLTNAVKSKALYHTLNLGVGVTVLGAMGPVGWGIAGAAVAVDITRGAMRVNRIQVKQDQLEHLSSLKQSQADIKKLEQGHSEDFLQELGKPKPLQQNTSIDNTTKDKDALNQATYKAAVTTAFKEGISVGAAAATAAVSHVGFAVATTMAFLSWSTGTKAKLTEQEAKDTIKDKISLLQKDTGFAHNPQQSRQYDLAKAAYEHAVYAKALEIHSKDTKLRAIDCKSMAQKELSQEPEFQKLFSTDKIEKPTSALSYIARAAKSTAFSVGDYLHPFKEATSYAQVHSDHIEKEKELRSATQQSAAATPTTPVHDKQAELKAQKERESLTSRSSASSERYSETTPLINRSRSQSHDSGRGL